MTPCSPPLPRLVTDYLVLGLVFLAGTASGFANVLAGGGSLIALPALELCGLALPMANATNRVAVALQNVAGLRGMAARGIALPPRAWLLALPACAGAWWGAGMALGMDPTLLRRVLGVAMVLLLPTLVANPKRWIEGRRADPPGLLRTIALIVALFALGVYGGLLQVGIGVPLLLTLVWLDGCGVIEGNAIKIAIVLAYTLLALARFAHADQVAWVPGLVLAAGSMVGADLAARLSAEGGARWVHRVLVVIVALCAARFLLA